MASESLEEKFPTIEAVDEFLKRARVDLMDLNHSIRKQALQEAEYLEDFQSDMNELIEEMKTALAVGAFLTARLMSEKIQTDYGIVLTSEMEEEYDAEAEGGEEE